MNRIGGLAISRSAIIFSELVQRVDFDLLLVVRVGECIQGPESARLCP
jgi:hypothetical protein